MSNRSIGYIDSLMTNYNNLLNKINEYEALTHNLKNQITNQNIINDINIKLYSMSLNIKNNIEMAKLSDNVIALSSTIKNTIAETISETTMLFPINIVIIQDISLNSETSQTIPNFRINYKIDKTNIPDYFMNNILFIYVNDNEVSNYCTSYNNNIINIMDSNYYYYTDVYQSGNIKIKITNSKENVDNYILFTIPSHLFITEDLSKFPINDSNYTLSEYNYICSSEIIEGNINSIPKLAMENGDKQNIEYIYNNNTMQLTIQIYTNNFILSLNENIVENLSTALNIY